MKRLIIIIVLVSLCIVVDLGFAEASSNNIPNSLIIQSGSLAGGPWYGIASVIAECFREEGIRVSVEPGGSASNVPIISKGGENQIGVIQAQLLPWAEAGNPPFDDEPPFKGNSNKSNLYSIAALAFNFTHIIVDKESNIESITNLKGKPFATQPKGQGSKIAFQVVLEAYGMTEDDLKIFEGGQSEGRLLMQDKHVIGMTATTLPPSGELTQLATAKSIKLLSLDEQTIKKIREINPGLIKMTLPAESYPGQDKAVEGVGTPVIYVTNDSMSEEHAYFITKIIVENLEKLKEAHAGLKTLTIEKMKETGIPLHPGAKKYYDEILD